MNNFEVLRKKAKEKWSALQASSLPIIYLGAASCGKAAGALDVLETIHQTLSDNKLNATIIQTGCIGPCYLEPLMDIKLPGKPRISYSNVTPEKARRIIESYLIKGNTEVRLALGHFGENGDAT